jgi:hypothetical protein
MQHARRRWKIHISFQSEILKGKDHMGDPGVPERLKLNGILKKHGVSMWTGFI